MFIDDTVRLLLDSLGHNEEYEFYIKKFRSGVSDCFALLCPDSDVIFGDFDSLLVNLRFLMKLELLPVIVISNVDDQKIIEFLKQNHSRELLFCDDIIDNHDDSFSIFKQAMAEKKTPVFYTTKTPQKKLLIHKLPRYIKEVSSRVHFIRREGGLRDNQSNRLLYVKDTLPASRLHVEDRSVFCLASDLLSKNLRAHISICSPHNLLKEIFTVKGAGTILKISSDIQALSIQEVDSQKLNVLLENSFKRQIKKSFDYAKISHMYLEKNYTGAILLEEHKMGFYLSKFAVGSQARGIGVGQDLWDSMIEECPALFWRSRAGNSINRWYKNKADGFHKLGVGHESWFVFWKGIGIEKIPEVIQYCKNRIDDFE